MERIAIFAALQWECQPVLRQLRQVTRGRNGPFTLWQGTTPGREVQLMKTGMGLERAAAAARALSETDGFALFVSTGCAGALAPELVPGDLAVATAVVCTRSEQRFATDSDHCERARNVAAGAGLRATLGPVLCSPRVLATAAEKRAAAAGGAVAVEMEGASIAQRAAMLGVPFLSVRAILDTAEDELAYAGKFVDLQSGGVKPLALAGYLITHPGAVPGLLAMQRMRTAAQTGLERFFDAWFRLPPFGSPKETSLMRFPMHITTDMMKWQLSNWWRGQKRFPFVLMLEPLHTCNLACLGCSPERYNGDLKDRLSLEESLQAVDEAGTPVVSICGGEPTIYPELPELVDGIIARKRHIYLCTNGILLDRFYKKGRPHKRLSINVHLDGMRKTHDFVVDRAGVFDQAVEMIKEGKRLGYSMCTNTTIYRETEIAEIEEMCAFLTHLGVDGILLSPGYHYEKIKANHFLFKTEIHQKFKQVLALSKKYRLYSTPPFLQFAAGERDYPCTPWGNPTRTPRGWKGPCYLIEGGYYPTWKEFWNGVDWDYWESRQDPKCQNCLMHSGFEPSVVRKLGESPRDLWTMAKWNFLS